MDLSQWCVETLKTLYDNRRGMSQCQLAEIAGVEQPTVSAWFDADTQAMPKADKCNRVLEWVRKNRPDLLPGLVFKDGGTTPRYIPADDADYIQHLLQRLTAAESELATARGQLDAMRAILAPAPVNTTELVALKKDANVLRERVINSHPQTKSARAKQPRK